MPMRLPRLLRSSLLVWRSMQSAPHGTLLWRGSPEDLQHRMAYGRLKVCLERAIGALFVGVGIKHALAER